MEISVDFLDAFSPPKMINKGTIGNESGERIPYILELGLSKSSILECNQWQNFINNFVMDFADENPDITDYKKELQKYIMLEDHHWNWPKKAFHYNTSEYNWFFLKTSDGIQGVCMTFHPKKSVIQSINIFYITYIASAPWNRESTLHKRKYKGVATEIIKKVQIYFLKTHNYNYGFCLHSLPQAQSFYQRIGMINYPEYNDEQGLLFYEMSNENAITFLGGSHA